VLPKDGLALAGEVRGGSRALVAHAGQRVVEPAVQKGFVGRTGLGSGLGQRGAHRGTERFEVGPGRQVKNPARRVGVGDFGRALARGRVHVAVHASGAQRVAGCQEPSGPKAVGVAVQQGVVDDHVGSARRGEAVGGGVGSEFKVCVAHVAGLVGAVGMGVKQGELRAKGVCPALPLGLAGRRPVVSDPEHVHG